MDTSRARNWLWAGSGERRDSLAALYNAGRRSAGLWPGAKPSVAAALVREGLVTEERGTYAMTALGIASIEEDPAAEAPETAATKAPKKRRGK